MPFLRFTRDKRGYETTSLVHAGSRTGRSRQRILYWFRTPPGVKVGRPALDEDAIRLIEEQNPDIEFDWPRILDAQPAAAPSADDSRARRSRRDRPRPPRPSTPQPAGNADRPGPPPRETHLSETALPALQDEPAELPESELDSEPETELEPLEPEIAEAVEQLTRPEHEEKIDPPAAPAEPAPGREQFARLRARYVELLGRITERAGDPERVAALRADAEALNPDMWVTADDVRRGLESFEPKIRDLRAALGLRRRRRSRRGGRRRRGEQPQAAPRAEDEGEA